MEKLTQRQFLNAIINNANGLGYSYDDKVLTNDEVIAFAQTRILALDKKAKKDTISETTLELRDNANKVLDFLKGKGTLSFREIREEFAWSPQKASPIMKYLVDNDMVKHEYQKRVNYYSLKV